MKNYIPLYVFSLVIGASIVSAQTLTANDPRPMKAMVEKLQALSGIPINYEDPPFENAVDMQDVTDLVARNRTVSSRRIVIPRGGELQVSDSTHASGVSEIQMPSLFAQFESAYEAKGYPGRFAIARRNDAWYVEPSAIRDASGAIKPVGPVMSMNIDMAFQQRTGAECLQALLAGLSQVIHRKIAIGTVPFAALSNVTACGAQNEPAAAVLIRLERQLEPAAGNMPWLRAHWAYRLLFDPGDRIYVFNMEAVVQAEQQNTPPSNPSPEPGRVKGASQKTQEK